MEMTLVLGSRQKLIKTSLEMENREKKKKIVVKVETLIIFFEKFNSDFHRIRTNTFMKIQRTKNLKKFKAKLNWSHAEGIKLLTNLSSLLGLMADRFKTVFFCSDTRRRAWHFQHAIHFYRSRSPLLFKLLYTQKQPTAGF